MPQGLSILFVRFSTESLGTSFALTSFNSLCEIHAGVCMDMLSFTHVTFNSLCEIQKHYYLWIKSKRWLSILFVRFWRNAGIVSTLRRFPFQFSLWDSGGGFGEYLYSIPFNSLCEIRAVKPQIPSCAISNFQFSLWDSGLLLAVVIALFIILSILFVRFIGYFVIQPDLKIIAFNSLCEIH